MTPTMRTLLLLSSSLLLLACGGPRKPGPHPNEIIYWRITASDLLFANCSDNAEFRADIKPVPIEANTFLIYKVDAEGKHATGQSCTTFDPATCKDTEPVVVFDAAGNQLLFTKEKKTALGDQGCMLQSIQQWTLTDKGEDLDVEITNTLSEVDNPTACDSAEASIKAQSPNKLGLSGCVVTFTLTGTIKPQ
jgi:hypothetical protein